MVGRHRKPPAWRRMLTSLLRSQRSSRMAALQAEVAALRATVTDLRRQLDLARSELAERPVAAAGGSRHRADASRASAASRSESVPAAPVATELRWLTLQLPMVRAALADAAPTLEPTIAPTIAPAIEPAVALDLGADPAVTRIVLPESALLDPRIDRAAGLVESLLIGPGSTDEPAEATEQPPGQAVA